MNVRGRDCCVPFFEKFLVSLTLFQIKHCLKASKVFLQRGNKFGDVKLAHIRKHDRIQAEVFWNPKPVLLITAHHANQLLVHISLNP